MAIINAWSAVGVVNEEPKLMKLSGESVMARTILRIEPVNNGDEPTFLPVTAFNKKAHVLCAIAHRGSTIFAKGTIFSKTTLTSNQGKTLIGVSFKITDFAVLEREPINVSEENFADVVQLYEPEAFLEDKEEDENVE